jgi:2'-5' RNA ligase
MDQQLTLFQTSKPPRNRYRLFVAIFLDREAVHLIGGQEPHLRDKFGLSGKARPRHHLHVTLHHIGDYPDVSEQVVAATTKACASALAGQPSFEVTFDHVKSFRGRPGELPFVLVNPNGNAALLKLHRLLITELAKYRLASRGDLKFVPHVTMLYDRLSVPEQPVRPVRWTVKEMVLVLSHLGATKYERRGCWTLSE